MDRVSLGNFIEKRMRMSHIYQPVMLMALLKNVGNVFFLMDNFVDEEILADYLEISTRRVPVLPLSLFQL